MAITSPDDKDQKTNAAPGARTNEQRQNSGSTASPSMPSSASSMYNIFNSLTSGISLSKMNASAATWLKALNEYHTQNAAGLEQSGYRLAFSISNTANVLPTIIAILRNEKRNKVAYAIGVAIEESSSTLADEQIRVGDRTYSLPSVTADLINSPFEDNVTTAAASITNFNREDIHRSSSVLIPADLNPIRDPDAVGSVYKHVLMALLMVEVRESNMDGKFNLAEIGANKTFVMERIFAALTKIDYNVASTILDVAQRPTRNDINLKFYDTVRNAGSDQITRQSIGSISAYIDIRRTGEKLPAADMFNYVDTQQQHRPVLFRPVLTITDIRQEAWHLPLSFTMFLIGLTTMTLANRKWIHALGPTRGGDATAIDYRDTGNLNHELKLMTEHTNGIATRIDTKADGFDKMFDSYMKAVFGADATPLVCLHIPGGALNSPALRVFRVAGMTINEKLPEAVKVAQYNNRQSARKTIYNAMNAMTNGKFAEIYGPEVGDICYDENNRVLMGTYVNSRGETRDLREIDQLAIMNLCSVNGSYDAQTVGMYSNSIEDINSDMDKRLAVRAAIVKGLVPSATIDNYAVPVLFEGRALVALAVAMSQHNVRINELGNDTNAANDLFAASNLMGSNSMSLSAISGQSFSSFADTAQQQNRGFGGESSLY